MSKICALNILAALWVAALVTVAWKEPLLFVAIVGAPLCALAIQGDD